MKRDDEAWNQKTKYTSAGDTRTNDRDAPPKRQGKKGMSPLEKLVKAFHLLNEPESEEEETTEHVKAVGKDDGNPDGEEIFEDPAGQDA